MKLDVIHNGFDKLTLSGVGIPRSGIPNLSGLALITFR
jgi:hypothetical protein